MYQIDNFSGWALPDLQVGRAVNQIDDLGLAVNRIISVSESQALHPKYPKKVYLLHPFKFKMIGSSFYRIKLWNLEQKPSPLISQTNWTSRRRVTTWQST